MIGRDGSDRFQVEHVDGGVAEGLAVEELRPVGDRAGEVLGVVGVDEGGVDAHPPERHVEKRTGTAVEGARGDDVVAGLEEGEEGGGLGRLPGGGRERSPPVLERRHPLLEDGRRRVHEPGVDVPEGLEVEQARGVIRVVEHVRGGLVDGHRPRPGRGVRELPRMQAQGLDAVIAISHRLSPLAPLRGERRPPAYGNRTDRRSDCIRLRPLAARGSRTAPMLTKRQASPPELPAISIHPRRQRRDSITEVRPVLPEYLASARIATVRRTGIERGRLQAAAPASPWRPFRRAPWSRSRCLADRHGHPLPQPAQGAVDRRRPLVLCSGFNMRRTSLSATSRSRARPRCDMPALRNAA